jgi:nitrite reductase (NO-forming)
MKVLKINAKLVRSLPFVLLGLALLVSACGGAPLAAYVQQARAAGETKASVRYTLMTDMVDGRPVFVGQGGGIEGATNPRLSASPGQTIEITLVNGDGARHDIVLPGAEAASGPVEGAGSQTTVTFQVYQEGSFVYYSSVPGDREAGMQGWLVVGRGSAPQAVVASAGQPASSGGYSGDAGAASVPAQSAQPAEAASIVRDPTDLPGPIGDRPPQTLHIDIQAVELTGQLADGTTYTYWTFDGKVPGPFLRVRVGDTVELSLSNPSGSSMVHSIDLHAVTGPGGGAAVTQVQPGETKSFAFQALNPGLYVYHCAMPMVAHHIANGMYGLILVEPEGGLPPVDREFYVMQGEIYTMGRFGEKGHQDMSMDKLLDEAPEYFVFNGAVGALTDQLPLKARTGETVRIFMGVGGPNFISSFHVIGEIFDRVFDQASLTSLPLTDVQTTLVPPGGATMVEFGLEVPGRYLLVDHALSRAERGLAGYLVVEGEPNPEVFFSEESPDGSH